MGLGFNLTYLVDTITNAIRKVWLAHFVSKVFTCTKAFIQVYVGVGLMFASKILSCISTSVSTLFYP